MADTTICPDPTAATKNEPDQMGRIFLTSVGDSFNPKRDMALGPQCFLGNEEQHPGWDTLDFIDPFPGNDALEQARFDLTRLINHLVERIAEERNAHHATRYSVDFWRMIMLAWLCEITQRAWTQWVLIERLAEQTGKRPMRVETWPEQDELDCRFVDTAQFMRSLLRNDAFNWWIDSQIVAAIAPPNWRLDPTHQAPTIAIPEEAGESLSGPRRLGRYLKRNLGFTHVNGTKFSGLLLAAYANLLPRKKSHHRMQPVEKFDPETVFPAKFLAVLDSLISATMPESLRNNFSDMAAQAGQVRTRPGRLRLGTIDYWIDREKMIAAFAHEAGERLVPIQHGGFYGFMRFNILATEGEYRYGSFLSWGWTRHDDYEGNFVALPSPLLSKIADTHKEEDSRLIIVGDPIRFRITRIAPQPRGAGWLKYCRHTVQFIDTLGNGARENTVFRPYMGTETDLKSEYITGHFSDTPILSGDLHAAMIRCRLLVMTSPGTTMIMAMAANIPMVGFWDPGFFTLSESARTKFDRLRDCGIIHSSPEAAAEHVNAVWDDVSGWWESDDVQRARKEWAETFARTHRFWWWHWIKALTRLRYTA